MAQFIVLLLLSLVSCALTATYDVVRGIPDSAVQPFSLTRAPDCTGIYKMMCANCTHFVQCQGKPEPAFVSACSSLNAANKYCDDVNLCQATHTNCSESSDFTCTAEGFMPDAYDCSRYHYCQEAGVLIESYTCPSGYVYDVNIENCKRRLASRDCITMTCAKDKMIYVAHAGNKAYYAFCNGPQNTSMVMRCDDVKYEQVDVQSGKCAVTCTKEGVFPDLKNCRRYYQCALVSSKLQLIIVNCPMGTGFDDKTSKCIKTNAECSPELVTEAPKAP